MTGLFVLMVLAAVFQAEGKATKCQSERDNAQPMPGRFIPQCEEDGSYSEVQCHGSTGFCWCVTDNGEKIQGTEIRFRKPDCKKGRSKSKCETERDSLVPMPGRFIPRCEKDGSYSEVQCHGSTGYCWCVNEDGEKVKGTEKRFGDPDCGNTKRRTKSKCETERDRPMPVPMAGRFIPRCEKDGSYSEVQCHGSTGYCWCVNEDGEKVKGTEKRFETPNCGRTKSKCETERDRPMPVPMAGRFIPRCEKDGSYSEVQCHGSTGYCWCVNEDGEKVKGTEKRFGDPDCGNTKRRTKTDCETLRDNTKPVPGRFIPQCKEDGSYSEVQCHASSAFCWCVNENGEKLEGTERRFKKPDCKRGKTKCEKERETATPKDGVPALGRFVPQCEQDGSYSSVQCHGSTGYCWCVNTNGEKIAGTEQRFKKPTCGRDCLQQRSVALKQTSLGLHGIFVPVCESDGTYKEIQCFGKLNVCWCVDQVTGTAIENTHKIMVNAIPPKCKLSPCEIEKKKAQDLKKRPLLGVFEPECQSNGKYKPVQCLENSCYCVNEDDGSRIGKVVEWKDKDSLNC